MDVLFTKEYQPLWALALALALYLPVRHLIWVMYVRRAMRDEDTGQADRDRLKRRAGFTSALLCFVFAFIYTSHLFRDVP